MVALKSNLLMLAQTNEMFRNLIDAKDLAIIIKYIDDDMQEAIR